MCNELCNNCKKAGFFTFCTNHSPKQKEECEHAWIATEPSWQMPPGSTTLITRQQCDNCGEKRTIKEINGAMIDVQPEKQPKQKEECDPNNACAHNSQPPFKCNKKQPIELPEEIPNKEGTIVTINQIIRWLTSWEEIRYNECNENMCRMQKKKRE